MVATGLRSVEAAMQFVYDTDEITGKMAHIYVGYIPAAESSSAKPLSEQPSFNPDDTEAAMQLAAAEALPLSPVAE